MRNSRARPCEEPRWWPMAWRSTPATSTPRCASRHRAAEPNAPSPTTTTSLCRVSIGPSEPAFGEVVQLRPYGGLGDRPQRTVHVRVHALDHVSCRPCAGGQGVLDLLQAFAAVRDVEVERPHRVVQLVAVAR